MIIHTIGRRTDCCVMFVHMFLYFKCKTHYNTVARLIMNIGCPVPIIKTIIQLGYIFLNTKFSKCFSQYTFLYNNKNNLMTFDIVRKSNYKFFQLNQYSMNLNKLVRLKKKKMFFLSFFRAETLSDS